MKPYFGHISPDQLADDDYLKELEEQCRQNDAEALNETQAILINHLIDGKIH